jgi:peptide deformylase
MELTKDLEFLRAESKVIQPHQIKELEVLLEALNICRENNGIGLAAPQIGIPQRWAVINLNETPYFIFNPEILERDGEILMEEGCLSLPHEKHPVRRSEKIRVKYQELDGRYRIRTLKGLEAVVYQHELDHLNGKLISD